MQAPSAPSVSRPETSSSNPAKNFPPPSLLPDGSANTPARVLVSVITSINRIGNKNSRQPQRAQQHKYVSSLRIPSPSGNRIPAPAAAEPYRRDRNGRRTSPGQRSYAASRSEKRGSQRTGRPRLIPASSECRPRLRALFP